MVERPIKKSERQPIAEPSDAEPSSIESSSDADTPSSEGRNTPRPFRGKDKAKGKDKGKEEGRATAVSPALMRGPKPTKPKPPVVKKAESDSEDEAEQDAVEE